MAFLYTFNAVNHFVNVLILTLLNSAGTFYSLRSELLLIDSKLILVYNSYAIEFRTIITTLLFLLFKIILTTFYCAFTPLYCVRPLAMQAIHFIPTTASDLPLIMYYFIFRAVHFRLKIMTVRLTNDTMDFVKYKSIYKSLVIFTDKIKKSFDVMVRIHN